MAFFSLPLLSILALTQSILATPIEAITNINATAANIFADGCPPNSYFLGVSNPNNPPVIGFGTDKMIASIGQQSVPGTNTVTCTIKIPNLIPGFRLKSVHWKFLTVIDSGFQAVISGSVGAVGGSVSVHDSF